MELNLTTKLTRAKPKIVVDLKLNVQLNKAEVSANIFVNNSDVFD